MLEKPIFALPLFRLVESDDQKDLPPLVFRANDSAATSQATSNGLTQPKKRLIEEISLEQAPTNAKAHSKSERLCIPAYTLAVKHPDSKHPKQRIFIKVTLPGVSSADQVDLEVSKVS